MAELSPFKPSNPGDYYIGHAICLISKCDIRYEGLLYLLNTRDSTIGLKNVRSYGTEDRRIDGPQIPPSDKLYEFILFRGSDIKDLQVKSSPAAQTEEQFHNDPAIVQLLYPGHPLGTSPSASVGGKIESAQGQNTPEWLNTPSLTSRAYSAILPPYQSVNHIGLTDLSQATQNAVPSFSSPIYWRGHNGTSIATSHASHHSFPFQIPTMESSPLPVQNQMQASGMRNSPIRRPTNASKCPPLGLTNVSASITPISSATSNPCHPKGSPSLYPVQSSSSPDIPSTTSSMKISPQFHVAGITANKLTTSSVPWSSPDTSTSGAQNVVKEVSDPVAVHSNQFMSYSTSSFVGSTPSSFLTPVPSLLIPDQLAQSRSHALSSAQNMYRDHHGMVIMTTLASSSPPLLPTPAAQGLLTTSPPLLSTPASQGLLTTPPPLFSTPASKEPLLPLPSSVQQHNFPTIQFTEEFDFQAMNEKFEKDEVWRYLGKARQRDKAYGTDENATDQSIEDKESPCLVPNFDPMPAYKKDEFFDTISCNSLAWERNGQHHFSEPMKLETETCGNSRQISNLDYYGGYGGAQGNMYHDLYSLGRGCGHGGRGRGNTPF